MTNPDRTGSSLDAFLAEEGILDDVEAVAIERVQQWVVNARFIERSRIRGHGRRAIRPPGYFRLGPNDMERGTAWFIFPRKFWPLADMLRQRSQR